MCCAEFSSSAVSNSAIQWTIACQAPLCMEIFQARILEWVAILFSRDLPNPGIEPGSSALQIDALPSEPLEKPQIIHTYT